MLKALQKRTKRADLSEALMSSAPAERAGLIGDDADGAALEAAKADDDVGSEAGLDLEKVLVVDDAGNDAADVIGDLGDRPGTMLFISGSDLTFALKAMRGASSRLLDGRKLSRRRQSWRASSSSRATRWTTPALFICEWAPPSSSAETTSPVTCLMTWGPVMNIWACWVWMTKSVSAGLYAAPPGAGSADEGDLRNGAGEHDVVVEDAGVAGKAVNALLNACSAGVVDKDEGAAGLE